MGCFECSYFMNECDGDGLCLSEEDYGESIYDDDDYITERDMEDK